jgi:type II secretory pathway pseudopilin PulG
MPLFALIAVVVAVAVLGVLVAVGLAVVRAPRRTNGEK